jgi:hypothetical protein
MTALLLENLKLIVLFLLIGAIIGLSYLSSETLPKIKPAHAGQRRRAIGPRAKSLAAARR